MNSSYRDRSTGNCGAQGRMTFEHRDDYTRVGMLLIIPDYISERSGPICPTSRRLFRALGKLVRELLGNDPKIDADYSNAPTQIPDPSKLISADAGEILGCSASDPIGRFRGAGGRSLGLCLANYLWKQHHIRKGRYFAGFCFGKSTAYGVKPNKNTKESMTWVERRSSVLLGFTS